MPTLAEPAPEVIVGVDTHLDFHVAAAIDTNGRIIDICTVPASHQGFRALLRWAAKFGRAERFGVEGTGSYGATLARFLLKNDRTVIEVNRPNRQLRRRRGKSDSVDAESAARAVLNGEASALPKTKSGEIEKLRMLRMVRSSAIKARAQAMNQMRSLLVEAPDELRKQTRAMKPSKLAALCAAFRPATWDTEGARRRALRSLARRWLELHEEVASLDDQMHTLVEAIAPTLLDRKGVGVETASSLLIAAGDNPERLRNEASFAALCGVSPIEATSGKRQNRHRLNRGGDRNANNALWRIAMVRLSHDDQTKTYAARRRTEGKTSREILRCLKRFISREIYHCIMSEVTTLDIAA